jgi:hypothetical protein
MKDVIAARPGASTRSNTQTAEHRRLLSCEIREADWKKWGPFVSDRAWGTVREDYSSTGSAWEYFPHDHARSRAYRWSEDGLAGVCNRFQNICLAVALWNGQDPILKERLFGLTGNEGNHGEDVKEVYFYLDSTPTHSYMKMLYRYPQVEFPYARLVAENQRRGRDEPEFELIDALGDSFAQKRYFDVFIEYARATQEDWLCRISAVNRGPDPAPIHLLPHLWYRNVWSWGYGRSRPVLKALDRQTVYTDHAHLGERWWHVNGVARGSLCLLFTDNDTNADRLFGAANSSPYVKDGINDAVVDGRLDRVNPAGQGSKVAAHFQAVVDPGSTFSVQIRFTNRENREPFSDFDAIFIQRIKEADEFYAAIQRPDLDDDARAVQRQAFAGLMWTKQFYHYAVELWLRGDPGQPPPPELRRLGRNSDWEHLYNLDVISMPDKWEYPWYAVWDLAFHTLPIAMIDPEWAKRQLVLMLREWYMHPNGQIPAYEWAFGDVNPPVHAWAAWRVYKIARNATGQADTLFLERVFHKLLLNFTWWVNRKDIEGHNVFQGGFLGLDNIGVFDRSAPLPTGGYVEQADGTAWMGMYCLNMLAIALELALVKPSYEDVATKFFEHFIYIAQAINHAFGGTGLWDAADGFYYDMLHTHERDLTPLRIRSFVGLIPLFAVEALEKETLQRLPRFRRRIEWFIHYRPELAANIPHMTMPGMNDRRLLSLISQTQLARILTRMLDPDQFLSEYGLRSLSKEHEQRPFTMRLGDHAYTVQYEPGESDSGLFGGNSNWRGPIWFPLNFLMIESLQKYYRYCGDSLLVEMPHGSANYVNLDGVATELSRRLIKIFLKNREGKRPVYGNADPFQDDPHWRDHVLFYEYFHGETGAGLGASHQTGWTALVAKLIQQSGGGSPW